MLYIYCMRGGGKIGLIFGFVRNRDEVFFHFEFKNGGVKF